MGNHTESNKRLSLGEVGEHAYAALSATTANDAQFIGEQYIATYKYILYKD